jgi:16S rRNA (guanine1207-N2)-methyltransferase
LEAISQVILRNEGRLAAGPVLLVNPPRDTLVRQLQREGRSVRCATQDFGDYRWLESAGAAVAYGAAPEPDGSERTIILRLPREKELLHMLLHATADRMNAAATLWLVGEKRAGIKSAPRQLKQYFQKVAALDNARHCGLLTAAGAAVERPFDLADYTLDWSASHAGNDLQLHSLPGVFAHGRLDRGTALLLAVLARLRPQGRILDFACGCGIVGTALLAADESSQLTFLDSSALAIESSRLTLTANGMRGEVLPSDGLTEVRGCYDWIVSNPPFHRGVASDLDTAAGFFQSAGTFLAENGKIVIVFNRHLPYLRWLHSSFDRVERLAENEEFIVIQASRSAGRGKSGR